MMIPKLQYLLYLNLLGACSNVNAQALRRASFEFHAPTYPDEAEMGCWKEI